MRNLLSCVFGLAIAWAFIFSCGLEPKERVVERTTAPPTPVPIPTDQDQPVTWREVKTIVEESCGINGCHSNAGFLATEAGFRNSNAKNRILNGSMPPRYADNYDLWQDGARKQRILEFLRN